VEDSVITVQGRINDRDGAISIFGQELQVLDVSSAERDGAAPVRLQLPYHRVTEQFIGELKRIMGAHPGQNPVQVAVRGPRRTTVYSLPSMVDATTIASDIKGSFGPDAWQGVA
jgi:DNA polymerase-3 subunit alpha